MADKHEIHWLMLVRVPSSSFYFLDYDSGAATQAGAPIWFPLKPVLPENISPLQPGVSYIARDWVAGLYKACNLKLVTECRTPKLFLTSLVWICTCAALGETGAGALGNKNSLILADKSVLIKPLLKGRFWWLSVILWSTLVQVVPGP